MNVLLDAGILIHAEFGEPTSNMTEVSWGPMTKKVPIAGFRRKPPDPNPEQQREKDALFTIGRLIRECRVTAYRYNEVTVEYGRRGSPRFVNALSGCELNGCEPAIDRTKLFQTISGDDEDKGGKKDKVAGKIDDGFSQISAFTEIKNYTPPMVEALIKNADLIDLTPFEVGSLRDLAWFRFVCDRSESRENYPDVFHLWTAERHGFAFLTLEKKLGRLVQRIRSERKSPVEIKTKVYRPTELLEALQVSDLDPVPLEFNRFYPLHG